MYSGRVSDGGWGWGPWWKGKEGGGREAVMGKVLQRREKGVQLRFLVIPVIP